MSGIPFEDDILIRPLAGDSTRCVLVNAKTLAVIAGPLAMSDCTARARAIAEQRGVTIWQEQIDDRGRPLGPPRKLYVPIHLT